MDSSRILTLAIALYYSFTFGVFAADPAAPTPEAKAATPTADVVQKTETGGPKRMIAVLDADGVQHATLTGGEYFLDPNLVVVKVNKPVELSIFKITGYIPHNLIVTAPEAGIDFKVDFTADKPVVIKFTPTKLGSYPMYCDKQLLFFKSHRERGMEGMIEVVE